MISNYEKEIIEPDPDPLTREELVSHIRYWAGVTDGSIKLPELIEIPGAGFYAGENLTNEDVAARWKKEVAARPMAEFRAKQAAYAIHLRNGTVDCDTCGVVKYHSYCKKYHLLHNYGKRRMVSCPSCGTAEHGTDCRIWKRAHLDKGEKPSATRKWCDICGMADLGSYCFPEYENDKVPHFGW